MYREFEDQRKGYQQIKEKNDDMYEKMTRFIEDMRGCQKLTQHLSLPINILVLRKMIMDVNLFYEKRNESVYYSVLRDLHRLQVIPQNLHYLIAIPHKEFSLDIDDSDLHLTPAVCSSNSTHIKPSPYTTNPVTIIPSPSGVVYVSSSTRVEPYTSNQSPVRIIPGPAGLVQQARLLKEKVFILDLDGDLMSTQQYMGKVVEDVGDDDDFKSAAWVNATNYVNTFMKSCSPNILGNLNVTMKDLSGTIPGTIHHKVIGKGGYGKDIIVGAAMILTNVSVFSPNPSKHYLNITMRNVVEVFRKDTVLGNGSG
nr:hypothetical protein [Tanacetum cinerariifolium]